VEGFSISLFPNIPPKIDHEAIENSRVGSLHLRQYPWSDPFSPTVSIVDNPNQSFTTAHPCFVKGQSLHKCIGFYLLLESSCVDILVY